MRKKAFILLLVLITIFSSSCSGTVYIGEPPATQEERDANITEYGVIAEIYYDTFEEPTDENNVQNILEYNGFEFKNKYSDDRSLQYETYEKTARINELNYNLELIINYHTQRESEDLKSVYYGIKLTDNNTFFTVYKEFLGSYCELELLVDTADLNMTSINIVTGEVTGGYGGENNPLYQNYLNGDYDAQITEMETIMEEELQPLPEDYVAPSTTK